MSGGLNDQSMEFSVVAEGYDRAQVDTCLGNLGGQLARLAAQAEAGAQAAAELASLRDEVIKLRAVARGKPVAYRASSRLKQILAMAEEEAAEIVAQAHEELAAARREAEQIREETYEAALQARRDFETALHARRCRERQVDDLLRLVVGAADATDGAARQTPQRPSQRDAAPLGGPATPGSPSRWPRLHRRRTAAAG
jgi:hypothetical protein